MTPKRPHDISKVCSAGHPALAALRVQLPIITVTTTTLLPIRGRYGTG